MQENKYYTPSLEEFHVGFEFEFKHSDYPEQDWMKYSTPELNMELEDCPFAYKALKDFRVKFLDREDIESLGFVFSGKSIDDWYKKDLLTRLSSGHWISQFKLQHDRNNSFQTEEDHCYNIKIYACISGCDDDVLFEGIIKNKSELKQVLKMLGIK